MPPIVNHENSLRGVLNFNGRFVSVEILDKARRAFLGFIECYKENEIEWQEIRDRNMPRKNGTYRRITLIHETFNHCGDKDAFLRHFFASLDLKICGNENEYNFDRGLAFVEESLGNKRTYDGAKVLLEYADGLLIFYVKSRFMFNTYECLLIILLK